MHSNVLMRKQRVTVAIAMALSFVLSAHGQGSIAGAAQSPLGENALSQVVVTASRSHVRIEQMPLHTTIVSQQDILRSAAQTLDQLFQVSISPAFPRRSPTPPATRPRCAAWATRRCWCCSTACR